jgi:DNA-directed RNA polymerase specialized sigma24 family protein
MFVDEVSTRESLARMVRIMTANGALQDDLLQEALIHIWMTEVGRPGQTRSWYLQSCKYHLLHYLAAGRSVDSGKRRAGQLQFVDVPDGANDGGSDPDSGDSVLGCVSARDIIALLWPHLKPQERAVLECFADGLRLREIGRKLGVSHTLIVRHRRKIASLLNRFETNAMIPRGALRQNGFVRNGTVHARNGHRKSGARSIGLSLPAGIR